MYFQERKRFPGAMNEMLSFPMVQQWIVFILAVILMLSKLGGCGLAAYDDAFYAQKAKEILITGDWLTLHYDGAPEFQNPPLFIWLIALFYKLFGINEFAALYPSALMGVATVLLVYKLGQLLFEKWTAFFSAVILATTFIFTRFARRAMVDVTLTFFVTLALFCFILALRKNPRYFLGFGLSTASAILTKSVLGLFPLLIALIFLVSKRYWAPFRSIYFYIGGIIALGIGFSWHIVNYIRYGYEFLRVHFLWLIIERACEGIKNAPASWTGHLSYVKELLVYYWPWLPVFVWGIVRAAKRFRKDESRLYLLLWAAVIFIVMSFMETRFFWYIMPIFPAASILCGSTIAESLSEPRRLFASKIILGITLAAFLVIDATPLKLSKERETDIRQLAPYVRYCANQGSKIIAFRLGYYKVNNALLFYSNHSAKPVTTDCKEFKKCFKTKDTVLCLIDRENIQLIRKFKIPFHIVRLTREVSLIANREVDVSVLKTGKIKKFHLAGIKRRSKGKGQ